MLLNSEGIVCYADKEKCNLRWAKIPRIMINGEMITTVRSSFWYKKIFKKWGHRDILMQGSGVIKSL